MSQEKEVNKAESEALELLRTLLVGEEIALIHEIQTETQDSKQQTIKIADILPEAILTAHQEKKNKLIYSLTPIVQNVLKEAIKREPKAISHILFPVIGPAIRKAIRETLKSMLNGFETALENSFSPQAIKWRIQSWQTGQPFSEILLLHSLAYQVEQVFLIQQHTGLLIAHVQSEQAIIKDPDMISAMLTAIQDFILDSFDSTQDKLSSMSLGDLTVRLYQGPQATLATVIRGNLPAQQHETHQNTLEQIHLLFNAELEQYNGNPESFNGVKSYLQDCLVSRFKREQKKSNPLFSWKIRIILFILILGLLSFIFNLIQENKQWHYLEQSINQEVGWILQNIDKKTHQVHILRDPLARSIPDFLHQIPQKIKNIKWQQRPFLSLQKDILKKRIKAISKPSKTTKLQVKSGVLILSGKATKKWMNKLIKLPLSLLGISRIDTQQLKIISSSISKRDLLQQLKKQLNPPATVKLFLSNTGVLYLVGEAREQWIKSLKKKKVSNIKKINIGRLTNLDLAYQQAKQNIRAIQFFLKKDNAQYASYSIQVEQVIPLIKQYFKLAHQLNIVAKITIQGYTDNSEMNQYSKILKKQRSAFIYQQLLQFGFQPEQFLVINSIQKNVRMASDLSKNRQRKVVLDVVENLH